MTNDRTKPGLRSKAIKRYFGSDGKPVDFAEMKELLHGCGKAGFQKFADDVLDVCDAEGIEIA